MQRTVSVRHCILECTRPFEEAHRALVAIVPALKPELGEMLAGGEREKVDAARKAGTAPAALDEEGKPINPHIPRTNQLPSLARALFNFF